MGRIVAQFPPVLGGRGCAVRTMSTFLLAALLVVLAANAHSQATKADRAPAFAGDALVAAPTANWATNGGDWYNRRWSPLTGIDRGNVASLKGV